MSKRPSFLSRKYLIHSRFQLQLISYFLSFYGIVVGALYLILSASFKSTVTEAIRIAPHSRTILELYAADQTATLNWVFFIFGFVGALFTFIGGIFISHRAVGPLYRLRRLMLEASQGRFPDIVKNRKSDYFGELFVELGHLLSTVEPKDEGKE